MHINELFEYKVIDKLILENIKQISRILGILSKYLKILN